MIKTPHILLNEPDTFVRVVETIPLQVAPMSAAGLMADGVDQNWMGLAVAAALMLTVFLMLARLKKAARGLREASADSSQNFAATVEIPPYIDTTQLASVADGTDPSDATARLNQVWERAQQKVETNPLYNPNITERLARDALDIDRLFCTGKLSKSLPKLKPDALERFAAAAETLGAGELSGLIDEARALTIRGHSAQMREHARKGPEWAAFRKDIADLEARLVKANCHNGHTGRLVLLADAYVGQIASEAA